MYTYFTQQDDFYDNEKYLAHPCMESADIKKYYQEVTEGLDKILAKHLPYYNSYKDESLFNILESFSSIRVTYAVSYIEPLGFHEKISPLLQCEPETALLVLKQMHYDENDRPILYSVNYFKSNKFSFHVLRKRM